MSIEEEMKKALTAGDPPAADPADDELKDPADPADHAKGGVTPPVADPVKEPDPVPHARFNEVNERMKVAEAKAAAADQENRKLLQDLADLAKSVGKGDKITTTEKVAAKEDIETLVEKGEMTRVDADRFLRVLDAAGVRRGNSEVEELKKVIAEQDKKLKTIETSVFGDKDQAEKAKALVKFDGIVTAETLDAKLKEMVKSGDPDRIHMANHSSYEKIIKAEFADDIIKSEVSKALADKKPPAPKIAKGKGGEGPKKPAEDEILHNPSNPRAFDADLRAAVKRGLQSAE